MNMKKQPFLAFLIVIGSLTAPGLGQTDTKSQAELRARAEALSQSCSAEFDDPASPQYKQCADAIALFEQMHERQPKDAALLLTLARLYVNRSGEKAIQTYQRVLVLEPGNVTAHLELGRLLSSPDERIEHFRAVVQSQPDQLEAHGRLAQELALRSQVDEAVAQIKLQIQIDPGRTDIIANVIQTLMEKGHANEAGQALIAYLRSALPAQVKCGDARLMLKQYASQKEILRTMAEQCPGYTLYNDALERKDPHERVRLLEEAIKAGSTDARAHAELAMSLLQLNQVDRAMTEMQKQIKLDPVLAHDQIMAFAAALSHRTLINDSIKVYLTYLGSQAPNELVCEPMRKVLVAAGDKYSALARPFEKRCGALAGPARGGL